MSAGEIVKIEWVETSHYAAYVRLPEGETFETFDQDDYDLDNGLGEINTDAHFDGLERSEIQICNQVPPCYYRPPYSGQVEELDWDSIRDPL